MRRGGIEPPAPRRCWMATENFTTKPSALQWKLGFQEPPGFKLVSDKLVETSEGKGLLRTRKDKASPVLCLERAWRSEA
ncbi:uncharacterized protein CTRU02_209543 [Colletotrichum truncatum]|uniref:Uncharacterized protein n=1 Tax=Colletotrichum truncatum TaxID=5467 RepID=A0ACC3YUY4_COLTU|nr:uncharacterized protein CTRU02_14469 [Colletotrichum truncatum]KAF6782139.1 hypothetical protein CTRU02_14469 [Colletotrichum truncatum]